MTHQHLFLLAIVLLAPAGAWSGGDALYRAYEIHRAENAFANARTAANSLDRTGESAGLITDASILAAEPTVSEQMQAITEEMKYASYEEMDALMAKSKAIEEKGAVQDSFLRKKMPLLIRERAAVRAEMAAGARPRPIIPVGLLSLAGSAALIWGVAKLARRRAAAPGASAP